jgi:hypothetical protein
MYSGKLVFAQLMEHLPMKIFHRYVQNLQWQLQSEIIQLPRPISMYGFCPANL